KSTADGDLRLYVGAPTSAGRAACYERLTKLGVEFSMKPTEMGTVIVAVFNDTCENNIQLVQEK
ncbi:MAG: VOC family protein, partial [Bacteroidota bacterium]